jgi:hypothetical protein
MRAPEKTPGSGRIPPLVKFGFPLFLLPAALAAAPIDFGREIEPVLERNCYECHSHASGKSKGGLVLDSRGGWMAGGEHGSVIEPGRPENSRLITALSHRDSDLRMPPKKRLDEAEIALLTAWVKSGAPDPRGGVAVAKREIDIEEGRTHWAFQPLSRKGAASGPFPWNDRNPIDVFIGARLKEHALTASPRADARTLIRRASFDLTGLPPTFEEVESFATASIDHPESAFRNLIDRLLASPRYGERWGRHWLDVARYADTTEQSVDGERRIPFAHTYRDYVIDAFNADKPFDRFILEQIAGDRLSGTTAADLRGLGFFGVGRKFFANADGPALRVDDRIDTIGRGFLGLTLACARCHDHKFDPIPTKDYYSLYGILDSFEEPLDLPAVRHTGEAKAVAAHEEKRAKAIAAFEAHVDACVASSNKHLRDFATEYLQYIVRSSPVHRTTDGDIPLDTPRGWLVYHAPDRWAALLQQSRERDEPFFRLWHRLMALPKEGFADKAREAIEAGLEGHPPAVVEAFRESPPRTMLEAATTYGGLIEKALKTDDDASRGIVDLVFGKASPVPPRDRDEVREDLARFLNEKQLVNRSDGEKAGKLLGELHVLDATGPVERAMTVQAKARPGDAHVFIRGDMKLPGAAVPRRFLQVLSSVDSRSYDDDGRLQLAQAIASPRNPLTARVIVNRVWQHHFGAGLVATPDDFGTKGSPPTHPELLDHLAAWFMEHGWSLKELHRCLMTSAAWRQSSAINHRAMEADPSNTLLWRMPPRRLEFEPMRDALLFVAGRLDERCGGRGALLDDKNMRRAVYGYTDRFRIPALLRNFDVANPDTSMAQRSETLVPLQALFLMNSGFVRQQAEALQRRPDWTAAKSVRDRIIASFRLVLGRHPSAEEARLAVDYLTTTSLDAAGAPRWTDFVQGLLLSNEFVFVD